MSQPRGFIRLAAIFYGGVIAVAWLYAWIFNHLPELFGTNRPTFLFLMQGVLILGSPGSGAQAIVCLNRRCGSRAG